MLERFNQFIVKEKLFDKKSRILLAVSGGIDSIVMCELFHQSKFQFSIAHCNFQLRGKESFQDELFVKSLAKKYKVHLHSSSFETQIFSEANGVSIQMAARELRYEWFEKIRKENNYDCVAVAHHKDDSIETFFINLIRGTGISGLHGILPRQKNIVRPLLFATKNEIENFARKNKLVHREDSSNSSDKYLRNKIRHSIIPVLKEINSNIEEVISKDIGRIREVEQIYLDSIEKAKKKVLKIENGRIFIPIKKLQNLSPVKTYLFEFLRAYNFNSSAIQDIIEAITANSGKQFYSSTHRLVKDREMLIITKRDQEQNGSQLKYILKDKKGFKIPTNSKIACLDRDLIKLPLQVRKWKNGDFFFPLGMKQKKKLSDFLIDNKVSIPDKENMEVLISGKDIVWVIGMRVDDRYKVTERTKKIYVCEISTH